MVILETLKNDYPIVFDFINDLSEYINFKESEYFYEIGSYSLKQLILTFKNGLWINMSKHNFEACVHMLRKSNFLENIKNISERKIILLRKISSYTEILSDFDTFNAIASLSNTDVDKIYEYINLSLTHTFVNKTIICKTKILSGEVFVTIDCSSREQLKKSINTINLFLPIIKNMNIVLKLKGEM